MSYLLALAAGLLTALPLLFDELFLLPWFSLVPLFCIAKSKQSAYRHGLVFSLGYYAVLYHWFCYLYPLDFAGFNKMGSILVVAVAWIGMSLLQGVGTAFVPFLYRQAVEGRKALFAPFAAASLWCVMEWLQTQFWFGVPWGRLAVTQYTKLPMIQSASLIGSLGVGFLMVLVNGFFALAIETWQETRSLKQPAALVAALLFVANLGYGAIALAIPHEGESTFVAAAIQGNIASGDKWADDSLATSLAIYTALTEQAVEETGASLVVWPETVITTDLSASSSQTRRAIGELAARVKTHIAVGAYYHEDGNTYNAIYLFAPDGTTNETVYKKRHPVPFGEYVPMRDVIETVLPFLADINMLSSDLAAGDSPELFDSDLGRIGALVCFDSIYETLTLDSVREGADLMVLSTNDSWYKDSAAVYQHNGHAVLRAVETGRSFVRAANTGISSIITEKGETQDALAPLVTGYAANEVSTYTHTTLYTVIGNLIVLLSFGYLALLQGLRVADIVKKHSTNKA